MNSDIPFTRINSIEYTKKSSLIAQQILNFIRAGVYPPDGKIPSERLIAEKMGVGRPAVREAISALQISGVLESRPGDGTYVCAQVSSGNTEEIGVSILEECDSPFEALQVRKALEIGVVHLAIQNALGEDIKRIKRTWSLKRKSALSGDIKGFIQQGRVFHLAIAEATGSRAIVGLTETVLKMTHQPLWLNMRERFYSIQPAWLQPMVQLHDDIVDAMDRRDSAAAIRLVQEHYDIQLQQHYSEILDGGENPSYCKQCI